MLNFAKLCLSFFMQLAVIHVATTRGPIFLKYSAPKTGKHNMRNFMNINYLMNYHLDHYSSSPKCTEVIDNRMAESKSSV